MSFDAVILAGGRSSRMGQDKALLRVGAETLLERQARLLHEAGAAQVFVSAPPERGYRLPALGVLLPDPEPEGGPLVGISTALAATRAARVLVLAVDLPGMTLTFLRWLLSQQGPGAVPLLWGELEPLAAIYPTRLAKLARERLAAGKRSARGFAHAACEAGECRGVPVPVALEGALANWNRPGEWREPG